MKKLRIFLLLFAALFIMSGTTLAANEGIGWIPTWDQAAKEAQRANKPILLVAGAPQCGGVPGVW